MKSNYLVFLGKIFLVCIIIFSISCSEVEKNAQKITIEDIKLDKVAGYDWFDFEYQDYNLDKQNFQDIINNFDANSHKILIYTGPSCSCGREFRKFPAFIKILDTAKITSANYEIFSMGDKDFSHPYENIIRVNTIPSFIVMYNNKAVYSINDSILKHVDSYPNSLEFGLMESLKKK